jgi:PleD family two-component response regulator
MPVQVPDGSDVKFTISVGYAGGKILEDTISTTVRSSTVREVLARADSALYEAKRSGRNRALGAREDTLFAASSIPTLSRDVVSV